MPSKDDDLSFEGAWKKQIKQEQEEPVEKKSEETKEVKHHQQPNFRGQKDMVEKRQEFMMTSKPRQQQPKKEVKVVEKPSSREGDDFDVEW